MNDPVNHPDHYNTGEIEVLDAILDWKLGFCLGNVVKYVARADHKGNPLGDLEKAAWYLSWEIKRRKNGRTVKGGIGLGEIPPNADTELIEELGRLERQVALMTDDEVANFMTTRESLLSSWQKAAIDKARVKSLCPRLSIPNPHFHLAETDPSPCST